MFLHEYRASVFMQKHYFALWRVATTGADYLPVIVAAPGDQRLVLMRECERNNKFNQNDSSMSRTAAAAATVGLENGYSDVYMAAGVSVATPLQLSLP